jgi:hypothetical protein
MPRRTVARLLVALPASAPAANLNRSGNQRLSDATRAANLIKDLRAPIVPRAVERSEVMRVQALALGVYTGRISLAAARAQLRGAA